MSVIDTPQPWKQRMAHDYVDDDEDGYEEKAPRRVSGPRFGPFVTIAVAILMLFGAASRIGKPVESGNWLSLDLLASKSLNTERLRLQEQRNTTLVTLGAVPVAPEGLRPPPRGLHIEGQVLPPPRGEIGYDEYQEHRLPPAPPPLRMVARTEGTDGPDASESYIPGAGPNFDPAPEAPLRQPQASGSVYVVASGDNWVKIGKATGRKWQDLQKANPQAADGLRVGMQLTVP